MRSAIAITRDSFNSIVRIISLKKAEYTVLRANGVLTGGKRGDRTKQKDGTSEEAQQDVNRGATPRGKRRMLSELGVMEAWEKEIDSILKEPDGKSERDRLIAQFRPKTKDLSSTVRNEAKHDRIMQAQHKPVREKNKRQRETGVDLTAVAGNELEFNKVRANLDHKQILIDECLAWKVDTASLTTFTDYKKALQVVVGKTDAFKPKTEGMRALLRV